MNFEIFMSLVSRRLLKQEEIHGRVDEEIFLGGIMDKIRENIAKARFIVADISAYNPNVYYELGLAEGMQKDIIMLTSNVNTLPLI